MHQRLLHDGAQQSGEANIRAGVERGDGERLDQSFIQVASRESLGDRAVVGAPAQRKVIEWPCIRNTAGWKQNPPGDAAQIGAQRPALAGGQIHKGEQRSLRAGQRASRADRVQVSESCAIPREQEVVAVVDRQPEFAVGIGPAAAAGDRACFIDRGLPARLHHGERGGQPGEARSDNMDRHRPALLVA